jgi:hypothetical protein
MVVAPPAGNGSGPNRRVVELAGAARALPSGGRSRRRCVSPGTSASPGSAGRRSPVGTHPRRCPRPRCPRARTTLGRAPGAAYGKFAVIVFPSRLTRSSRFICCAVSESNTKCVIWRPSWNLHAKLPGPVSARACRLERPQHGAGGRRRGRGGERDEELIPSLDKLDDGDVERLPVTDRIGARGSRGMNGRTGRRGRDGRRSARRRLANWCGRARYVSRSPGAVISTAGRRAGQG